MQLAFRFREREYPHHRHAGRRDDATDGRGADRNLPERQGKRACEFILDRRGGDYRGRGIHADIRLRGADIERNKDFGNVENVGADRENV